MSGGNLPYHLRVKKDIERRLFVEQLRLISKVYDLEEYAYIGMAGPFSEDFRLMYDRFNFKNFFSYEMSEKVYARQQFNIPFSQINYIQNKIIKFIDDYPDIEIRDDSIISVKKSVLWLDYTGLEFDFLDEFQRAISILDEGSIVKITLLTHASNLYSNSHELHNEVKRKRVENLKEKLGVNYFFEDVFDESKMSEKAFPKAVFQMLKKVAYKALEGTNMIFLPIASYIYQDGMKMLTFTGIKIRESEKDVFLEKTGLKSWEYSIYNSSKIPLDIDVPFLSLKEKYHLDACLPNEPDDSVQYFNKKELDGYKKFYKFYSSFAKII